MILLQYEPIIITVFVIVWLFHTVGQLQVMVSSAMSSFDSFSTASVTYPVLQDCAADLCESKNDTIEQFMVIMIVYGHHEAYE